MFLNWLISFCSRIWNRIVRSNFKNEMLRFARCCEFQNFGGMWRHKTRAYLAVYLKPTLVKHLASQRPHQAKAKELQ